MLDRDRDLRLGAVAHSRARALVAAALSLALPALAYSGMLLTDVLFLPLATLAAGSRCAPSSGRPGTGRPRSSRALAACALTRLEANVIAIAFVVAAIVLRRGRGALARLGRLGAAWRSGSDSTPARRAALSAGTGRRTGSYGIVSMVEYVLYHAGTVVLVTGVVPVWPWRSSIAARPVEEGLGASLAVIASLTVVTVLEVGVFASRNTHHLTERTLDVRAATAPRRPRDLARPRPPGPAASRSSSRRARSPSSRLPLGNFAGEVAIRTRRSLVPLVHLGGTSARLGAIVGGARGVRRCSCSCCGASPSCCPSRSSPCSRAVSVSGVAGVRRRLDARRRCSCSARIRAGSTRPRTSRSRSSTTAARTGTSSWTQVFANHRIERAHRPCWTSVPGPLPRDPLKPLGPSGELRAHARPA